MEISDQITGTLEVQFTFLDEKEFIQKSRETDEKISINGNLLKATKPILLARSPSAGNADKTTLIVNAVQKDASTSHLVRPIVKITRTPDGQYAEDDLLLNLSNNGYLHKDGKISDSDVALDGQYGDDRGRRRMRKGDIFTSIRRRLSKGRSKSVATENGIGNDEGGKGEAKANDSTLKEDSFARSISADRHSLGRHLNITGGNLSTRSSASELSGLSGLSTSTFIHENSALVIECTENRIRRYYLVPPNLAETGKWKKRGKKLHIYNDHTFVAKHISSGTTCGICAGRFVFSLGKQGYQCRDCKMRCHKECHVRAPSYCPSTTVYDIELKAAKSTDTTTNTTNTSNNVARSCSFRSFFSKKQPQQVSDTLLSNSPNSTANISSNNSKEKTNKFNFLTNKKSKEDKTKTQTNPRKKMSIFRKMNLRLGRISEENLTTNSNSGNGNVTTNCIESTVEEEIPEQQQDSHKDEEKKIENDESTTKTLPEIEDSCEIKKIEEKVEIVQQVNSSDNNNVIVPEKIKQIAPETIDPEITTAA